MSNVQPVSYEGAGGGATTAAGLDPTMFATIGIVLLLVGIGVYLWRSPMRRYTTEYLVLFPIVVLVGAAIVAFLWGPA